jgi:hypothetical protein
MSTVIYALFVWYLAGNFLMFLKHHHTNAECGSWIQEMREMMGEEIKHSTAAVAQKKRMEI